MRLFNEKKAQEVTTSKVFYWLIGLIISVWLVLSLWGFGATFFDSLTKTPYQLNEDLFIARITNTCFAWTQQTTPEQAEVHPSILDLSKISDTRVQDCFLGDDILPVATIDISPLPSNPNAFSSRRATLLKTDSLLSPTDIIKNKKPYPSQERYVLVKNSTRKKVCGLRTDAIKEANKQQDFLFSAPVLLSEKDFLAIKNCIDFATTSASGISDPKATCSLQLSISNQDGVKYNSQPMLSDFCYSKEGACTYEDFLADYKGTCQTETVEGPLLPAELKVTFYD